MNMPDVDVEVDVNAEETETEMRELVELSNQVVAFDSEAEKIVAFILCKYPLKSFDFLIHLMISGFCGNKLVQFVRGNKDWVRILNENIQAAQVMEGCMQFGKDCVEANKIGDKQKLDSHIREHLSKRAGIVNDIVSGKHNDKITKRIIKMLNTWNSKIGLYEQMLYIRSMRLVETVPECNDDWKGFAIAALMICPNEIQF